MLTGHPVVDAIGQMHLEGNIIPHSWYHHAALRFESGKPNMVAIVLLSDVLYWYRPSYQRHEITGQIISVRKKFSADKLHKDYQKWADQFGFTKRQVQDAVSFLVERGLVEREIRAEYHTVAGLVIYNAVFVTPIPDAIRAITFEIDLSAEGVSRLNGTPITLERDTPHVEAGEVSLSSVTTPTPERAPLTKTNAKNKEKADLRDALSAQQQTAARHAYENFIDAARRAFLEQQAAMNAQTVEETVWRFNGYEAKKALKEVVEKE